MKSKFKIGDYVQWYNNIIYGKEFLSEPYEIIGIVRTPSEWLYTITGTDCNGKKEITQIYESGLYFAKSAYREVKLKRILKNN